MAERIYKRFRGKHYTFQYPIQRWMGPDQRGLPYMSYVIVCQDDAEYRKGNSSMFVWKDGAWKTKRVSLGWNDYKNLVPVTERIPRSFYPCQEKELIVKKDLFMITPESICLVDSVLPAGDISRIDAKFLQNSDWTLENKGDWKWSHSRYVEAEYFNRDWRTLTDEELYGDDNLLLPIMEANLGLG